MNNKKKWTKLMMVVSLAVLASLATAGLVLADHFPPAVSGSMSSRTSFEQYQAALDHAESASQTAFAASSARIAAGNSANFLPYPDAFDRSELDRQDVMVTVVTRESTNLVPYLDEYDRMELHWLAAQAKSGDDSLTCWQQYLRFAK